MEKSRVLERGLAVLECVAQRGAASLTDVAGALNLSLPAASRALEALTAAGYLTRRRPRDPYRLTAKLVRMYHGHEIDLVLREAALPLMEGFAKATGWPLLLGKVEGLELVVLQTVAPEVRRPIALPADDARMPYFLRAAGTVCVAFKSAREREQMVEQTAAARRKHDMVMPLSRLEMLHALTRTKGFMEYEPVKHRPAYLAVPVLTNYGLEVSYWPDLVNRAAALKDYLPRLKKIAKALQSEVEGFTARG